MKSPSAGRVTHSLKEDKYHNQPTRTRRVRIRVKTEAKEYLGGVPFPDARMDWEVIRVAKMRCELRCVYFDFLNGGCMFGRLPNECEFNKDVGE